MRNLKTRENGHIRRQRTEGGVMIFFCGLTPIQLLIKNIGGEPCYIIVSALGAAST